MPCRMVTLGQPAAAPRSFWMKRPANPDTHAHTQNTVSARHRRSLAAHAPSLAPGLTRTHTASQPAAGACARDCASTAASVCVCACACHTVVEAAARHVSRVALYGVLDHGLVAIHEHRIAVHLRSASSRSNCVKATSAARICSTRAGRWPAAPSQQQGGSATEQSSHLNRVDALHAVLQPQPLEHQVAARLQELTHESVGLAEVAL
jgi:hypothetical protein